MCCYRIPEEFVIDLGLEELTLTELLEVETALVSFMLSVLLLRCCHIIVEVSSESYLTINLNLQNWYVNGKLKHVHICIGFLWTKYFMQLFVNKTYVNKFLPNFSILPIIIEWNLIYHICCFIQHIKTTYHTEIKSYLLFTGQIFPRLCENKTTTLMS